MNAYLSAAGDVSIDIDASSGMEFVLKRSTVDGRRSIVFTGPEDLWAVRDLCEQALAETALTPAQADAAHMAAVESLRRINQICWDAHAAVWLALAREAVPTLPGWERLDYAGTAPRVLVARHVTRLVGRTPKGGVRLVTTCQTIGPKLLDVSLAVTLPRPDAVYADQTVTDETRETFVKRAALDWLKSHGFEE